MKDIINLRRSTFKRIANTKEQAFFRGLERKECILVLNIVSQKTKRLVLIELVVSIEGCAIYLLNALN